MDQPIRVSDNRRFLQRADGTPFFYLADTCWELFHRLDEPEIDAHFALRARQGFTVIQAVLLAEFEGLTVPNRLGQLPLRKNSRGEIDPALPDEAGGYWDFVDRVLDMAERHGLVMALLPTWGDKFNLLWGQGPVIFTPENARQYGLWLGERLRARDGLIWVLGGDRPLTTPEHRAVIDAMADGLRQGDGGRHLMTLHPNGDHSSSEYVHDAPYIDFHMLQTGHGTHGWHCHEQVAADYALTPVRPVLDGEPRYEDHPACFNPGFGYYYDAADVRQSAWWDVLSGACGHTYGNHCVWGFNREATDYFPYVYEQAARHDGAEDMRHLRALIEAYPYFQRRPAQELIAVVNDVNAHQAACRGDDYAFCYSPLGLPITVRMRLLAPGEVRASWYDPREGTRQTLGIYPSWGGCTFVPPSQGKGQDWVLILECLRPEG
ncbi:MAG: glycoside hydrolase family 140 protein [Christensenellales bacterium]|jgi:hypothetical protein